MAISIGGLMIDFGASTTEFNKAVAKVSAAEKKLNALEKAQNAERRREIEKLDAISARIDSAREKSDLLEAQADKASEKQKERIRQKLMQIGAQIEKNEILYAKLTKEQKTNEIARLGALTKANKELDALSKKTTNFSKYSASLLKGVGAAGAFATAGAATFKVLIDDLDKIAKRARDIKITASQLQELQHQASLAGISTGALDTAIKAFNRNISLAAMGTGEARQALESMGISLTDINGKTKTQSELLREVATYFAQNAGEAENAGRATRFFGECGAELVRIFEGGEGVVEKIFDAKGNDAAAKAAEQFKDSLTDLEQSVMPSLYKYAGGLAELFVKTFDSDRYFKGIAKDSIDNINFLSESTKKQLTDLEAQILKVEDELKNTSKLRIAMYGQQATVNPEFERLSKELETLKNSRKELQELAAQEAVKASERQAEENRRAAEALRNSKVEKENLKETEAAYAQLIKDSIALYNEESKAAEKRLKTLEATKKSIEETRKKQAESRAEFEYQTKIQILEAQGKTREAEALKFAKARNDLMEKYGYTLKQAEQVQRTLNELQKKEGGAQYSDEAKAKAKDILARGESGTIGKRTLEEAKAISEGKTPEGGFKTSIFKKFDEDNNLTKSQGFGLKKLDIDTKAAKSNLDKEAKDIEAKNSESLDSLVKEIGDLNKTIKDIKSTVDGIAVKKGAA